MNLYIKGNNVVGLVSIALALLLSVNAYAEKSNPLAAPIGVGQTRMTVDQAKGVSDRNLVKLLAGMEAETAQRGPGCGNGMLDPAEECDDGNAAGGDGCSASCEVEAGSVCIDPVPGATTENVVTNGSFAGGSGAGWDRGPLRAFICSDFCFGVDRSSDGDSGYAIFGSNASTGIPDSFVEQTVVIPANATTLTFDWFGTSTFSGSTCDGRPIGSTTGRFILSLELDGTEVFATNPDTACDGVPGGLYNTATIDLATAPGGSYIGSTVVVRFEGDYPNGIDGNANIFLDNIRVDVPLVPPIAPKPSACLVGVCGDGVLSPGEVCDDGNTANGDGCDSSCAVEEDGWFCRDGETALDVLNSSLEFVDDIADGSLEQGSPNADWAQTGTVFTPICSEALCGFPLATDGEWYAFFGGSSSFNSQTLTQTTTISTDASTLTFDLFVGVCDLTPGRGGTDVFSVLIDGTVVYQYFCLAGNETDGFEPQTIDLTGADAIAACGGTGCNDGGSHVIRFEATTYSVNGGNSNFFVDDISIAYPVSPDRAPNPSQCFPLDGICESGTSAGFGIEKFESGLGIMTSLFGGTYPTNGNTFTTTADEWTDLSDTSGCGSFDGPGGVFPANWEGGNLTGGSGEAACADSDGAAEVFAAPNVNLCLDSFLPECQTDAYICTPPLDTTNMTDPGVTATVHYQTARQDFTTTIKDDEIFQVLVGDVPPAQPGLQTTYRAAGVILDHDSTTLDASGSFTVTVNLDDFRNPAVQECVDPLEDPPCTVSGVEDPLDLSSLYVCFRYAGNYSWYGQVDNVASRADDCTDGDDDFDLVPNGVDNCPLTPNPDQVDSDSDGVGDACDNCTLVSNADQRDTNGDDIGNSCDADINNDCIVNFADLSLYKSNFLAVGDLDTDNNGDGITNFIDLAVAKSQFLGEPGPSAQGCDTLP